MSPAFAILLQFYITAILLSLCVMVDSVDFAFVSRSIDDGKSNNDTTN